MFITLDLHVTSLYLVVYSTFAAAELVVLYPYALLLMSLFFPRLLSWCYWIHIVSTHIVTMAGEQQINYHQTEEHSRHPGCFVNSPHTVEADPAHQNVGRKGKCITIEQAVDRAMSKEDFAREIDAILDDLDNGYLPVTDDEDNSPIYQKSITLLPLEDDTIFCSSVMTIQELYDAFPTPPPSFLALQPLYTPQTE